MSLLALLTLLMAVSSSAPVAHLLSQLKGVQEKHGYWIARCPAHDDRQASLSISVGDDGRALLKCHAGCALDDITGRLGLSTSDLFVDAPARANGGTPSGPDPRNRARLVKTYPYVDEQGALLYEVCRYEPKTFRQRRPDGRGNWINGLGETRRVLYRLPELAKAIAQQQPIFIVEGEKDADLLADAGYAATTNAMGAGKWSEDYTRSLKGGQIIIVPDNDDPGRAHAQQVATSLYAGGAKWVRVLELPNLPAKGDISDWLNDGHDLDELHALLGTVPEWRPEPIPLERKTRWLLREILDNDELMRPPPAVVPRLAWRERSTLFSMEEKGGKSTLISFVTSRVSTGGTFLGEQCERGPVLLVGLEEFLGDVARRLRHFEADQDHVYIVDKFLRDPKDRPEELREHILAADPAVVFVDTLAAYSESVVSDATSSSQMQPVVQRLTRLARETHVALVLVHHARRSDGKYRDSSAIGGAVDVIVECFVPDPDGDPTLRRARSRGRVPVHGFDFRFSGKDYSLSEPGSKGPLDQRIIAYVTDHPGSTQNAVIQGVGANRKNVMDMITAMVVDGSLLVLSGSGLGKKLAVRGSKLVPDAVLVGDG